MNHPKPKAGRPNPPRIIKPSDLPEFYMPATWPVGLGPILRRLWGTFRRRYASPQSERRES